MTFDVIVGLTIIGIIVFGVLLQKPARRAVVRKLAKTFVDVCNAHYAKKHVYQRGSFEMPDDATKLFYENGNASFSQANCTHAGDTENISLRPILLGGGYYQQHYIHAHHQTGFSLFHITTKHKRHTTVIRGMSASTFFNTGTVITSVAVENDQLDFPSNVPSQIIFNSVSFDTPISEFISKHQREVDLYLDNREGSACESIRDLDDCIRFANEKQLLMHDHVWKSGSPLDLEYIAQNIDPRFRDLAPDIKREVDRLISEQEEGLL